MKISSLILNISFVLLISCSNPINSNKQNGLKITLEKNILKINDSTEVNVQIENKKGEELKYIWSASNGEIIYNGEKAKFYAPSNPDTAVITVSVLGENIGLKTDSVEVIVYKQLVFLKADDIVFDCYNALSHRWVKFIDYIKRKNINASLGIIGNSLEKGNEEYFRILKEVASHKNFEFWNHGYNHLLNGIYENGEKYHEFWNTSYKYQKKHILKTQSLAKKKLNITIHTFGAPGNATDENTVKVIDELDDIKVWYYGPKESSKMVLNRAVEIELPVGNPSYQKFMNNYNPQNDYLVLQIHPNMWNDTGFNEFKKIIDYLIGEGITFIKPYEYYLYKSKEVQY